MCLAGAFEQAAGLAFELEPGVLMGSGSRECNVPASGGAAMPHRRALDGNEPRH